MLFHEIAIDLGFNSEIISGYSKGFNYLIGHRFSKPDHEWNAIYIIDKWYLIDVTWGTGYMTSVNEFKFDLNPFYFLCKPEYFISNHFPVHKQWQLLKQPITVSDYEKSLAPSFTYFNNQLELINPQQQMIEADETLIVTLKLPDDVQIISKLLNFEDNSPVNGVTFTHRLNSMSLTEVFLQIKGTYKFTIYSKKTSYPGVFDYAIEFLIVSKGSSKKHLGYPVAFPNFDNRKCYLYSPKQKYLKTGNKFLFKIKVLNAKEVALMIDVDWNYLTKLHDNIFEGQISVKGKEIGLYAKFGDSQNFDYLLKYDVIG